MFSYNLKNFFFIFSHIFSYYLHLPYTITLNWLFVSDFHSHSPLVQQLSLYILFSTHCSTGAAAAVSSHRHLWQINSWFGKCWANHIQTISYSLHWNTFSLISQQSSNYECKHFPTVHRLQTCLRYFVSQDISNIPLTIIWLIYGKVLL